MRLPPAGTADRRRNNAVTKRILIKSAIIAAITITLGAGIAIALYAAHERHVTETALADLKTVKTDDQRGDWSHLAIYNPTAWEVYGTDLYNVDVEYYRLKKETRQFLCKSTCGPAILKARAHDDLMVHPYYSSDLPSEINQLAAGSMITQKVVITFDYALKDGERATLRPRFELKQERQFLVIASENKWPNRGRYLEEVTDPSDPLNLFQNTPNK
jgi:hypothetical protein